MGLRVTEKTRRWVDPRLIINCKVIPGGVSGVVQGPTDLSRSPAVTPVGCGARDQPFNLSKPWFPGRWGPFTAQTGRAAVKNPWDKVYKVLSIRQMLGLCVGAHFLSTHRGSRGSHTHTEPQFIMQRRMWFLLRESSAVGGGRVSLACSNVIKRGKT